MAGQPQSMPAIALPPAAMYTADIYGPVHPDQSSVAVDTYPVFSGPLARGPQPDMTPVAPRYSGLVLDSFVGLHVSNAPANRCPTFRTWVPTSRAKTSLEISSSAVPA